MRKKLKFSLRRNKVEIIVRERKMKKDNKNKKRNINENEEENRCLKKEQKKVLQKMLKCE